jgi:phage-related protein
VGSRLILGPAWYKFGGGGYVRTDIESEGMSSPDPARRPLVWLHGEVKTPPFSREARLEAGVLLRRLQEGESLGMPHSRPMPGIAPGCHELRVRDGGRNWRIVYRLDPDAVVVANVFAKATRQTPRPVIDTCRRRLARYDEAVGGAGEAPGRGGGGR